jgi:hypothetical protein
VLLADDGTIMHLKPEMVGKLGEGNIWFGLREIGMDSCSKGLDGRTRSLG